MAQRIPIWSRLTIGDWFDRLATEFADREHIFTLERCYTYAQSRQMVDRLAKSLIKLGVARREHVALLFPTVPEMVFLQLALAKVGAVSVPLNERLGVDELEYQIRQSDSAYLIAIVGTIGLLWKRTHTRRRIYEESGIVIAPLWVALISARGKKRPPRVRE